MNLKLLVTCAMVMLVATQNSINGCCDDITVTVQGSGKAFGLPDIATFTITISETANTSKNASAAANIKINQVLSILASNNVSKNDIKTTQLTISPQYDWNNGNQTLRGQQASQSINVKLRNFNSDGTTVGSLIDALATINNITLSGINFDINDKALLNRQARQASFTDAKTKAQQYAQLSGLRLGDVLTVTDNSSSNQPIFYAAKADFSAGSSSTPVSVGQVQVDNDLTITFKLL